MFFMSLRIMLYPVVMPLKHLLWSPDVHYINSVILSWTHVGNVQHTVYATNFTTHNLRLPSPRFANSITLWTVFFLTDVIL